MEKQKSGRKVWLVVALGLVVVAAGGWTAWRLWPPSAKDLPRSVAIVERRTYYEVQMDGKTRLFFSSLSADSCLSGMAFNKEAATTSTYATATWVNRWSLWPSCEGRMATAIPAPADLAGWPLDTLIGRTLAAERHRLARLKGDKRELAYYLRVHGVQDPGYQSVAEVASRRDSSITATTRLIAVLEQLADTTNPKKQLALAEKSHFIAYFHTVGDTLRSVACQCVAVNDQRQVALLQTLGRLTPDGVKPINILPWNHYAEDEALGVGFGGLGVAEFADSIAVAAIVPCHIDADARHDLPAVLAADGTPLFTKNGHFIGITSGKQVVRRRALRKLMRKGR